jgi:hypothetical protein
MPSRFDWDIRIADLPRDDNLWRLIWFGSVDFPNPIDRNRQASVRIALAKASLLADARGKVEPPIERYVSVGTLSILRIGDLFHNGKLISVGHGTHETFADIDIDPSTTEIVKAGSTEDGHYLLPLQQHSEHQTHTKSCCIRVKLPGDRRLIVPCLELVRFYFGSSSALLGKLFRPHLEREDLYDPQRSSLRKHLPHMHLRLADGIPARSAEDVARIVSTPEGWRSARWVGGSMAFGGPECYVRTGFPFTGRTSLRARGRWLPHGDRPRQTFVVHELLGCSHPFPFGSLSYDEAPGTAQSKPAARKPTVRQAERAAGDGDQSQLLVDSDAGRLTGTSLEFEDGKRFPDLRNKRISRQSSAPTKTTGGGCAHPAADTAQIAVGEPGSTENIRPVEFEAEASKEPPQFLQPILDVLWNMPGVDVRPVAKESGEWSAPLAELFPGAPAHWKNIEEDPFGTRPRQCSFLAVQGEACRRTYLAFEHCEVIVEVVHGAPEADAADPGASSGIGQAWMRHRLHDWPKRLLTPP